MQAKPTGKGLAAIYRQELIEDVTLFTSQSSATFYGRLFDTLDYDLPHARTGRKGFPKEAMLNAFLVGACEGFGYITDLRDYLDNNRLIAHYCGFDVTRPLPSYWTFDRFLKKLDNGDLKEVMASLVRKLYDLGVVDAYVPSSLTRATTPSTSTTPSKTSTMGTRSSRSTSAIPKTSPSSRPALPSVRPASQ